MNIVQIGKERWVNLDNVQGFSIVDGGLLVVLVYGEWAVESEYIARVKKAIKVYSVHMEGIES